MYYKHWHSKYLKIIYQKLSFRIRSAHFITRILFGVEPYPKYRQTYWDLVTLIMRKALLAQIKNRSIKNILEIGSGELALLSIYIAKRGSFEITAIDVIPHFVENAKINVIRNSVEIEIFQSNLFEKIKRKFDLIFFNAPYMPTEWGIKHKVLKKDFISNNTIFQKAWDGGEDGCQIIRQFLIGVSHYLSKNGTALLGVNTFYVNDAKIRDLMPEELFIESEYKKSLNPSKVFVLKRKEYE